MTGADKLFAAVLSVDTLVGLAALCWWSRAGGSEQWRMKLPSLPLLAVFAAVGGVPVAVMMATSTNYALTAVLAAIPLALPVAWLAHRRTGDERALVAAAVLNLAPGAVWTLAVFMIIFMVAATLGS